MSTAAVGHLRSAFEQMDLLLCSRQEEACLGSLVALLRHLQEVRQGLVA